MVVVLAHAPSSGAGACHVYLDLRHLWVNHVQIVVGRSLWKQVEEQSRLKATNGDHSATYGELEAIKGDQWATKGDQWATNGRLKGDLWRTLSDQRRTMGNQK